MGFLSFQKNGGGSGANAVPRNAHIEHWIRRLYRNPCTLAPHARYPGKGRTQPAASPLVDRAEAEAEPFRERATSKRRFFFAKAGGIVFFEKPSVAGTKGRNLAGERGAGIRKELPVRYGAGKRHPAPRLGRSEAITGHFPRFPLRLLFVDPALPCNRSRPGRRGAGR